MQALAGARGRNIQQTRRLLLRLAPLDALQIPVDRIFVGTGLRDRRQQQLAAMFQPQQQPRIVPTGHSAQAGQNDRVEFQALGFMDGHQLQHGTGTRRRLRE